MVARGEGGGGVRDKHLTEDFTHRITVLASTKSAVWAIGRNPVSSTLDLSNLWQEEFLSHCVFNLFLLTSSVC